MKCVICESEKEVGVIIGEKFMCKKCWWTDV